MGTKEKFLDRIIVNNLFLFLLPILLSGDISWFIQVGISRALYAQIPLCIGIILFYAHLVHRTDKRSKQQNKEIAEKDSLIKSLTEEKDSLIKSLNERIDKISLENNVLKGELTSLSNVFSSNAESINKVAHEIEASGKYLAELWNYSDACDKLCDVVRQTLNKVAEEGDQFAVEFCASIQKPPKSRQKSPIKVLGYSQKDGERTTIFFKPNIPKKFYSAKLFAEKSHDPVILSTPSEIEKHFYTPKGRYEQYIAIPVFCESEKMVGLIELIAFKGCKISSSEANLSKIVETFFKPYSSLFLLLNKIEKGMTAHPPDITDKPAD